MNHPDRDMLHKWHVAINNFTFEGMNMSSQHPWMYDAKNLINEIPRIAYWFGQERKGELPKIHRQCSHSESEPIIDNHLSCCLGMKCKECPFLLALEKADVTPEQLDEMKAWTCAAHILNEKGKRLVDDTEGYILTVDDKMYWEQVYESLSQAGEELPEEEIETVICSRCGEEYPAEYPECTSCGLARIGHLKE